MSFGGRVKRDARRSRLELGPAGGRGVRARRLALTSLVLLVMAWVPSAASAAGPTWLTGVEATGPGSGNTAVTVTFDGPPPVLPGRLLGRPGTVSSQVDGGRLRVITSRPDGLVGELTAAAAQANVSVVDVSTIQSSLQSVYLALTGRVYNAGRRVEI